MHLAVFEEYYHSWFAFMVLQTYSDAKYVGDPDDHRSIGGSYTSVGHLISWSYKKQKGISYSISI